MEKSDDLIEKIIYNDDETSLINQVTQLCDMIDGYFSSLFAASKGNDIDIRTLYPCKINKKIIDNIREQFKDSNKVKQLIAKIEGTIDKIDNLNEILLNDNKDVKKKLFRINYQYDETCFNSIESELENLGDFGNVLQEYHNKYKQFNAYTAKISLGSKVKDIIDYSTQLLKRHAHLKQKNKDEDNVFSMKFMMSVKDISGEIIEVKEGNKESDFGLKSLLLFSPTIYFGIAYEINENPLTEDHTLNEEDTDICILMNSFDNCISENFLKTYYNDIIFNDVLYSNFKKYSPLFFLLTVIKLSIDTGIISNVGISSESFVNTNFNKQFEKAVEDNLTNITITNLFNAYSSVAYSPFGYVFSFDSKFKFFKFTFDTRRNFTNYSAYKQKTPTNNNPRSFLNFFQNMATQKTRTKISVPRNKEIEALTKIYLMNKEDKSYSVNITNYIGYFEFDFEGEIGKGLGPTNEFYSNLFLEFQKKNLFMKTDNNYIYPLSNISDNTLLSFEVLGLAIARALFDDRVFDFPLSEVFLDVLFNRNTSIDSIKFIDSNLYKVITELQEASTSNGLYHNESIEKLSMSFVYPGHEELELIPNGKNILLTKDNIKEFINSIYTLLFKSDAIIQIANAFKKGFNSIFPIDKLSLFSSNELVQIMTSPYIQWTEEMLLNSLVPDHGYTKTSKPFLFLIKYMSLLDKDNQQKFLKFSTGSTRLPIGGFAALNPKLTVVKRVLDNYINTDTNYYLPSVMTCQNYLKLPDYSTYDILKEKMDLAINEGGSQFHLS